MAGGSALDPTHMSWISEGCVNHGAHSPEDQEPCSYVGTSLCRPLCMCAIASPVHLELLFVIFYMWSREANPELLDGVMGFLIPFSLLWGVFTSFFIKTK